jgi:hypothetical protein
MFNRARLLLSEWATYHGAHEVSVARNGNLAPQGRVMEML